MAKIEKMNIDYDDESIRAIVSTESTTSWWREVRLCLQSISNETYNSSDLRITIPWSGFLASLDSLTYITNKSSVSVVLSKLATSHLDRYKAAVISYEDALRIKPISYSIASKVEELGFKRLLTEKQVRNLTKITHLPAAASFSVPGAGKTTEALAFYTLKKNTHSKLLIISPKNAFAAWEEQIKECIKFPPEIIRLDGKASETRKILRLSPKVCIINYHKLASCLHLITDFLNQGSDNFIFVDESHRMKRGSAGEHGKAVLAISHLAHYKLILSGTPLPNSQEDIKPQLEFLYPELANSDDAIQLIQPLFVRTTKEELGLPKVDRKLRAVQLTSAQSEMYRLMAKELLDEYSASHRSLIRNLKRNSIRLLQLASNPALLLNQNVPNAELYQDILTSGYAPKIDYACRRARQLAKKGHKVIIWSMFVQNVELIATRLADLNAQYIHGGVDAGDDDDVETREGKIKKFHDDSDCMVLVANPAACSEGISLHKVCHHAIYIDRNFNAAQFLQSEDRIHRYGLMPDQSTNVEILYCENTIDEVVEKRLQTKFNLMNQALNDPGLVITYSDVDEDDPDDEDFKELMSQIQELL